jgi:hypothetical protein
MVSSFIVLGCPFLKGSGDGVATFGVVLDGVDFFIIELG